MPRNWLKCTKFADKSFILAGDTGQTEARDGSAPREDNAVYLQAPIIPEDAQPIPEARSGGSGI